MVTPARSRKGAYHHGDLKAALLACARERIEQGGWGRLTLRAVAQDLGVSTAAPYRHFVDREALLAAVLAEGFDDLTRVLAEARRTANGPAEALRATGLATVRFAAAHPEVYRLMFGPECDKRRHPQLLASGMRALGELVGATQACQAAGMLVDVPTDRAVLGAWSLAHGLASLHVDGMLTQSMPGSIELQAEQVMQLMTRGLLEPPQPEPAQPRRRAR